MKIVTDSRTADAYIAGEDMGRFSDEWYFRASSVARDLWKKIFSLSRLRTMHHVKPCAY